MALKRVVRLALGVAVLMLVAAVAYRAYAPRGFGGGGFGIDYEYYVIELDDTGRLLRSQFMRG